MSLNNREQQLRYLFRTCQDQGTTLRFMPSSSSSKEIFKKIAEDKFGLVVYDSLADLEKMEPLLDVLLVLDLEGVSFSERWKSALVSLQAKGLSMILIGYQLWLSFFADEAVGWNRSGVVRLEQIDESC